MTTLLWVTKTAQSRTLSRSEGQEQLNILSQAQTVSRQRKAALVQKTTLRLQVHDVASCVTLEQCRTDIEATVKASNTCQYRCEDSCAHIHRDANHASTTCLNSCSPSLCNNLSTRNCDWTAAERRSAVYFQEVTLYQILTLQRDTEFWKGIVPFSAEIDSGIRHLVVAIAATSELLLRPGSSYLNHFALTQCNKALRAILSSNNMSRLSLVVSCVLVAAYHLLRSDVQAADKSIESGLNLLQLIKTPSGDTSLRLLSRILTSLGQQHGFKLWAADITYQIDRMVAGNEDLIISAEVPKGPFIDTGQVLAAFKVLMFEFVAKPARNIALGAHIKSNCLFAQDAHRCFSQVLFHWEMFYHSLADGLANERLQLVQLKIGLLFARILFHSKLLASDELRVDTYTANFAEILRLGQEVVEARHAGRLVMYMDRIVNSALFTCSMFCREPGIRRGLISLLKSQLVYVDGLVNFVRGHAAEVLAEIEEHGLVVNHCYDIPEVSRAGICAMHCQQDRILCIGHMPAASTDRSNLKYHLSRVPPELDAFDQQEINNCLKGMAAAYKMYRKLDLHIAPRGYLRKMYYGSSPIDVTWRADILAMNESQHDGCGI